MNKKDDYPINLIKDIIGEDCKISNYKTISHLRNRVNYVYKFLEDNICIKIVISRYKDRLSINQISEKYGVSKSSVYNLMNRGLKELKEYSFILQNGVKAYNDDVSRRENAAIEEIYQWEKNEYEKYKSYLDRIISTINKYSDYDIVDLKSIGLSSRALSLLNRCDINTVSEMLAYSELRDVIFSSEYEYLFRKDLTNKVYEITKKYGCNWQIYKRRFKIEKSLWYSKYLSYYYLNNKSSYKVFPEILDKIDSILNNGLETVIEESINSELEQVYKDIISRIPDNLRNRIKITIDK